MINEKEVQARVNRRLSGFAPSETRRMRIRTAIHAEREEAQPMKRTISKTLVFAIAAVMLMASVAIAEHFNLFNFFSRHDERYTAVAPHATLSLSEPALLEHEHLGHVTAAIDSAYFDGLSLTLAYRIENSRYVEAYTPTAQELAAMQAYGPFVVELTPGEPGTDVYEAYNTAVANGTPFGYRQYTIYPSDHMQTNDGVDIPPSTATADYDEQGSYCEIREFETPLPQEVRNRTELQVSINMYQQAAIVWFDGEQSYMLDQREEIGTMNAVIPLTKNATQALAGTGKINGTPCTATAEVSPMAALITVSCDAPLTAFLPPAPDGTDVHDSWVEITVVDENGNRFRPQEGMPLDDRTSFTLACEGTGVLPSKLTLYLHTTWEGAEEPDLSAMDCILLTSTQ